jgi:plastocyanin
MRHLVRFIKIASYALIAWFLSGAMMVAADTVDVTIQGFAFSPDSLLVSPGTTVRWTNLDGVPHTSTSDESVWNSGNLSTNDQYLLTFDSLGTFPYHCNIHPSMTAKISVIAPPVPSLTPYGAMTLVIFLIAGALLFHRRKRAVAVNRK